MIDVYTTINDMISAESQCIAAIDKYKSVFYAIGTAIGDGQSLQNLMEPNSYGMLREYMPDFDEIAAGMDTYISNAMTVLAIYENNSIVEGKEEETLNAVRTLEAIYGEFRACITKFNAIANLINTNAEITFNRLSELGYITNT